MKLKQELEEIKNKDLSKMTTEEVLKYKQELLQKSNSAAKINKVGLKKILYNCVGYVCGIGIGVCLGRVLLSYVLWGDLNANTILGNLGIALLCGLPIVGSYAIFLIAKKNAKKLSQVCNDKITEIDRQIAVNTFRKELEMSKGIQKNDTQDIRTDESSVFDLSNYS